MTCDLQSPDNADTASRGTTIRLTPRNSYALAERKRIVVPREAVSALSSDDDVYAEYTSLLFADGGDMSLDGVDTPYYSIFES